MRPTRARLACLALCGAAAGTLAAAPVQLPAGLDRRVLLDNDSVLVARLRFAPSAAEEPHTHPFSAVVAQITEGRVDMRLGEARDTGTRTPGHVWFIPKEVSHAAANAGGAPFVQTTVALKPTRPPVTGPPVPAVPVPDGITRTGLVDNAETRVARVRFEPGARETVHSHEFDLVVVQIDAGRVETLREGRRAVQEMAEGDVLFLPRRESHAVANVGPSPFDVLSVAVR
jgi:quercetin dioxygenase-like cupin family protein